jgi:dimethylargininase
MFTRAIVRRPGANYAAGLTRVDLGTPDFDTTLLQHSRYCDALRQCGLQLIELEADPQYPDGTFVEDTAILTAHGALITRPGAIERLGEVDAIRRALRGHYPELAEITAPGTLDGGDICEADRHAFIGVSHRTDEAGAAQLAQWFAAQGITSSTVDIRGMTSILHLKSGIAYLGEGRVLLIDELVDHPAFAGYEIVRIDPAEAYAANAVRVNDHVLIAAGYPKLDATLRALGYATLALDMSEYAKMDGGLSCLSLRY